MRYVIIAEQLFSDDRIFELGHKFHWKGLELPGIHSVIEVNYAVDNVKGYLWVDEDVVWEDVSVVKESVLFMEEDQCSRHLLRIHLNTCPHLCAFNEGDHTTFSSIQEEVLLKDKERSRYFKSPSQARLAYFFTNQIKSILVFGLSNFVGSFENNELILKSWK